MSRTDLRVKQMTRGATGSLWLFLFVGLAPSRLRLRA